jgi:uncharacterized damage-inducible protein DinB
MVESLERRLRYNAWANDTLYRALRTQDAPKASLRAFQHVLETEMTWSGRIIGRADANVPLWGAPSWERCDEWLTTARARLERVAAEHSPSGYSGTFTYRNSTGREFESAVAESLEHMLLHSAQYRGEASGFFNATGKQAPDVDYIFWIRDREPGPGSPREAS